MKMGKNPTNISASVKARLYSIAKRENVDFVYLMRRYFQERFLFRLSKSEYAGHLILKGGLLFLAYDIMHNRPTKDIDFLGVQIGSDFLEIKRIFKEIVEIEYNDGVRFLKNGITVESITENSKYTGVRVHVPCLLERAKGNVQVDIGFGDKAVFMQDKISIPVLLDYEAPLVKVYSIESAIAEKFEAIVSLGLATSRMKDFNDITLYASKKSFKLSELSDALEATFRNRGTNLSDCKKVFEPNYKSNPELAKLWQAFLRRNKFSEELNFVSVVSLLEALIMPCLEHPEKEKVWNPDNYKWESL